MISDINIKVDRDLCFACGQCVDRCIMDNLRLSVAPCRQACPLNLNCQGYVRLIAQGKEEEAAGELRKYTPFAGILGRVCSRPCEAACERQTTVADGAVNIRALKRYLDEHYPGITRQVPEAAPESGLSAAVIGSGPAGLMAAYELRAAGHKVVVFEAKPLAGGLLRYGIPGFKLPHSEIDAAVRFLGELGVEFRLGCRVGEQIKWSEIEADFQAVVVAVGAGVSKPLNISGEGESGVVSGLELLAGVKNGDAPDLAGKTVVVIGGGNTAADAAVSCIHCGAKQVGMVCLENPREMPAYADELQEARELGVKVENCWGVSRIERTPSGRLALSLSRCLSVFDEKGVFAPQLDQTCGLHGLEADLVVIAIGQEVKADGFPRDMVEAKTGLFTCDVITARTGHSPKVFACGDCATGASSVVHAFTSGKKAAESAARFLAGENPYYERDYYQARGMVTEYQALPERAVGGRARRGRRDTGFGSRPYGGNRGRPGPGPSQTGGRALP